MAAAKHAGGEDGDVWVGNGRSERATGWLKSTGEP
jgi:hypothetical protein